MDFRRQALLGLSTKSERRQSACEKGQIKISLTSPRSSAWQLILLTPCVYLKPASVLVAHILYLYVIFPRHLSHVFNHVLYKVIRGGQFSLPTHSRHIMITGENM
ncbi:uncharacterized protein K460DRAFT_105271 [Cucurbitaria berberidis CBS 394.84]|uniref:Uncharacterized protein n=1 Tax=Cucurbitaria berberidis CBS 394.84 TaxID=1168544 RepID=A0A9P4GHC3_9PLEO|nr:uncharacterized protein K460DRAFT_105271 [Cucurbitaria berberidis CBS 394.84]KAF1845231.1 hypothetical protein K460DRAFT_105271 [Cucurbitaria berberidis CBS 394.84]